MVHVQRIAAVLRPVGTPAHAPVLTYLKDQLEALGYRPEVQGGLAFWHGDRNIAGRVSKLVLHVPGVHRGKARMLTAHVDSVPFSPGAADNGAPIAAILATLRARKTGTPLQDDLIGVLTDGEEAGLLGAELFVNLHGNRRDRIATRGARAQCQRGRDCGAGLPHSGPRAWRRHRRTVTYRRIGPRRCPHPH